MKNNLQVFNNEEFGQVRTIEESGKVYFCGKDIATALGYQDTAKAIKTHCKKDGWAKCPVIDRLGRKQEVRFIDEGNVYRLITHSKLETAERFESWVFDEVLPTLRKTGSYSLTNYKEEVLTIRKKNAETREKYANIKSADRLMKMAEYADKTYKMVLLANATKLLTGEYLLPLPKVDEKLYEAKEIGQMLGISANKVGRLANKYGLKTKEYGEFVWNKVPNMDKQVQSFMYRITVVNALRNFLAEVA